MKHVRIIAAVFSLFFVVALVSSCADPRKNCNHPDHGKYMQEQRMKKSGF